MSKFQISILVFFGFAIIAGVLAFTLKNTSNPGSLSTVTLWGTVPAKEISILTNELGKQYKDQFSVDYVEIGLESFEQNLIEALARGGGPDMILVPHDILPRMYDKLLLLSFASYPERSFKDSFIESAEVFLTQTGTLALPFDIDPLIMYWNRDIFSAALELRPPTLWDQLFTLSEKLTKRDQAGNIIQGTVALGDMVNINNSKEILSTLILQSGNPIVSYSYKSGVIDSVLREKNPNDIVVPAEEALRYFTEFSNPSKRWYSWNRSLPTSQTAFLGGQLAIYFGFASELRSIREKNPNLNFDIAVIPQIKGSSAPATFSRIRAISILKSSKNPSAAFSVANILTSSTFSLIWTDISSLPSALRADLATPRVTDAYLSVIYKSATMSRLWFDPDWRATYLIFRDMTEGVTSGRKRINEAVSLADNSIESLLSKIK